MTQYFKIVYRTTTNELYELSIPNAFDFRLINNEDKALVNTAATNILNANAIDTGSGDLNEIVSISFCDSVITNYDVSAS